MEASDKANAQLSKLRDRWADARRQFKESIKTASSVADTVRAGLEKAFDDLRQALLESAGPYRDIRASTERARVAIGLGQSALGITTGAAVIRPDAYLGLVAEGEVREAAAKVDDWLQATLRLAPAHAQPGVALVAQPVRPEIMEVIV